MTITDDPVVYYDPYDLDIAANPWPTYARLREEAPIYHNERYRFWAISRHTDVERAIANWETFSNSRSDILELVNSEFDMPVALDTNSTVGAAWHAIASRMSRADSSRLPILVRTSSVSVIGIVISALRTSPSMARASSSA